MSVVVGVQHGGVVYVGADSQATSGGGDKYVRLNRKVFSSCGYIIGVVGSSRVTQILKAANNLPQLPAYLKTADENEAENEGLISDMEDFFVSEFIPAVRTLCDDAGIQISRSNDESTDSDNSDILVAIGPWMVVIEPDWQVGIYADKYIAIGSGQLTALGSLATTGNMSPQKRVHLALQASAKHSNTVCPPFYILSTSGGTEKQLPK